MTSGQGDLVRYRMERAFETLQEARLMLESDYGKIVELDKEDMKADLEKAEEFIAHIRALLGSIGDGSL